MKIAIMAAALLALGAVGCDHGAPPPPRPGGLHARAGVGGDYHRAIANTVFGDSSITEMEVNCAGRTALSQGSATVNDACFTGDTNVVLCTDSAAPNPVMCSPEKGSLRISGTGSDLISYARIR